MGEREKLWADDLEQLKIGLILAKSPVNFFPKILFWHCSVRKKTSSSLSKMKDLFLEVMPEHF